MFTAPSIWKDCGGHWFRWSLTKAGLRQCCRPPPAASVPGSVLHRQMTFLGNPIPRLPNEGLRSGIRSPETTPDLGKRKASSRSVLVGQSVPANREPVVSENAITRSTRDSTEHRLSRLPSTQCDGTEHVASSISLSGICLSWWSCRFDSERSKEIEIITTGLDWRRTQQ